MKIGRLEPEFFMVKKLQITLMTLYASGQRHKIAYSMRTLLFLFLLFFRTLVVCVSVVCCESIFVIAFF
jgi:hypothetical protein